MTQCVYEYDYDYEHEHEHEHEHETVSGTVSVCNWVCLLIAYTLPVRCFGEPYWVQTWAGLGMLQRMA